MRLTIVTDDSSVIVDGLSRPVDCSSIADHIHAVQWDGANGTIEFKAVDGKRKPNQAITDIVAFQHLVDLWQVAPPLTPPLSPPQPPQTVLSQDLMAKFTPADISAVQIAIASNSTQAALWYAMLAQRDPMYVGNERFKAGWSALVAVLGQTRMTEIATALNVTIV